MQIARVQTSEDLSARLAFGDEVDLGGREICLSSSNPAPHRLPVPVPRTEQLSGGLSCVSWVVQDDPGATCWELAQHAAVLCNATFRIPEHACLYVLAGDSPGTWRNVTVDGASSLDVLLTLPDPRDAPRSLRNPALFARATCSRLCLCCLVHPRPLWMSLSMTCRCFRKHVKCTHAAQTSQAGDLCNQTSKPVCWRSDSMLCAAQVEPTAW